MIETTLTTNNQFTFDQSLLEHLGVKAGEKLAVRKLPDGAISIRASKKHRKITELAGALKGKTDVRMTTEEINQTIAAGYIAHGMRGLV